MKKLILTMLVGVTLAAALTPEVSFADGSRFRRRLAVTCSAMLATVAVGLSASYTISGKMPNRGFGSRVVWSSDRRAIVQLLARAFGLRGASESGGSGGGASTIEVRGFDPDYFSEVTLEEFYDGTYVTDMSPGVAKGHVILRNQLLFFELVRDLDGAAKYRFTSSPL